MDVRTLVTGLMVIAAGATLVAGLTSSHPESRLPLRARSFLLGALFLAFAWNIGARVGIFSRSNLPSGAMEGLLGFMLVMGAAVSAFLASRLRSRGELLRSSSPTALDDAIRRLKSGVKSSVGVFAGRLGASNEVASPGGVVCGFYDAEIRSLSATGERGPLVSVDRGFSSILYVRGESGQAQVEFSTRELLAPVTIRPCTVGGQLGDVTDLEPADGAVEPAEVPTDALSFERVGKLGEPCLVVGKLEKTEVPGRYRLAGIHAGPALVAMGAEALSAGRVLVRRSWAMFAVSAGLVMAAAYVFARLP